MAGQKEFLGLNVFDQAIDRLVKEYKDGHRIVVSFSGGKDSTVCLELCIIAATMTNRLPVDVVMRDEEIMHPGTYEYCERIYNRKNEVNLVWLIANQPIVNAFNREQPYFWVFDPALKPEQWVRQPPSFATYIKEKNITQMNSPERFPAPEGKRLYSALGMRVQESRGRFYGVRSMKGYISKPHPPFGVRNLWPIFDWTDNDIWKAIKDNKWDYNQAYNVMNQLGIPKNRLRIAPPTMSPASAEGMWALQAAFPKWFDKVCERLEGVRAVAKYGKKAVSPIRNLGETWEQCYQRTCIDEAPQWIRDRAIEVKKRNLQTHSRHSAMPLPDVTPCYVCKGSTGSWKKLCEAMYLGDPFSMKMIDMPYVEPELFRKGSGYWDGKPSF